jgi:hypothetical protein
MVLYIPWQLPVRVVKNPWLTVCSLHDSNTAVRSRHVALNTEKLTTDGPAPAISTVPNHTSSFIF